MSTSYIRLLLLLLLVPAGISSCFSPCEDTSGNTDLTVLNIVLDTSLPPYQTITKAAKAESTPIPDMRFIIAVYTPEGELQEKKTVTASDLNQTTFPVNVTFNLPNNVYRLVFWADFVEHGSTADLYYDTQDLKDIRAKGNYAENIESKDAFTTYKDIDLRTQTGGQIIDTVTLRRPFAKYQIIANDLKAYISKHGGNPEGITTNISYTSPIYNSYNSIEGQPQGTISGEIFTQTAKILSSDQLLLRWDFVWAGEEEITLKTKITIYDGTNTPINTLNNFEIPCMRNKLTTITGAFLTKGNNSGIGIVTDYEGEFNVPLP